MSDQAQQRILELELQVAALRNERRADLDHVWNEDLRSNVSALVARGTPLMDAVKNAAEAANAMEELRTRRGH